MRSKTINLALISLGTSCALCSCAMDNDSTQTGSTRLERNMSRAQASVDETEKKVGTGLKNLGPQLDQVNQNIDNSMKKLGPQVDQTEQTIKDVGKQVMDTGVKIGDSIENTTKNLGQSVTRTTSSKSTTTTKAH